MKLLSGWVCEICKAENANRLGVCHCGGIRSISKSRGLGDTIHKITTALHIPHCGECEQRRQALNKLLPYKSWPTL